MSPGRLMCLLYVGQFAFIKAPMVLAEAVTRVLSAVPDARFTWVCSERDHERAKALFDNPAVLRRVTLEGWCSQSDLQGIYDRHGLFLFPSFFEGFGKAFLEAMARGLVVVAARNGGMKDVIQSGENGVLVPTGDAISMAEACVSVMGDWQQSRRIVAAARRTALAYTWDRVADETTGFFRRLLDARLAAASA